MVPERDHFAIRKGATVVGTPAGGRATSFVLRVAGMNPSPAGHPVRLAYVLPRGGEVALSIVDAGGRRVRALPAGLRDAGPHEASWDGNDESGRRAPAGLYFAVLDIAGARRTARVVVVP